MSIPLIPLFNDLFGQYSIGKLSFAQMIAMSSSLATMQKGGTVPNNGLRTLLSLPLSNILPSSMTSILTDLNFLDSLSPLFPDEPTKTTFISNVQTSIVSYSKTPASKVVTPNNYNNLKIGLDDPLGLGRQQLFQDELIKGYNAKIAEIVQNNSILGTDSTNIIINGLIIWIN